MIAVLENEMAGCSSPLSFVVGLSHLTANTQEREGEV